MEGTYGTATSSVARSAVPSKEMTKLCGLGGGDLIISMNHTGGRVVGGNGRNHSGCGRVTERNPMKLKSWEQKSILLPLRYFQKYSQIKTQKQTKEQAPTCIKTSENPEVGKIMSLGKGTESGDKCPKLPALGWHKSKERACSHLSTCDYIPRQQTRQRY